MQQHSELQVVNEKNYFDYYSASLSDRLKIHVCVLVQKEMMGKRVIMMMADHNPALPERATTSRILIPCISLHYFAT